MTAKYIIVEGTTRSDATFDKFKEGVNEKIAKGYMPLGSPVYDGTHWIIQAMFKVKGDIPFSHFPNPNPLGGV